MQKINLFRSVRWKFIFIYFLLVFIALMIVGVFIIQQLESYHMDKIRDDFTGVVNREILTTFEDLESIEDNEDKIYIIVACGPDLYGNFL